MIQDILKKCTVEGMIVKLPPEQLERNVYTNVKKHLELIGGKWKGGKTQGFIFEQDPTQLLERVSEGDRVNLKKEYQFFATPKEVAELMLQHLPANLSDGYRILEPSGGDGALIKAIQENYGFQVLVDTYEKMDLNRIKLKKIEAVSIKGEDFLTDCPENNYYDIILANPPFTKNQDIDHIMMMHKTLKPGGIMVSLASMSWTTGSQKKQVDFRQWLEINHAEQIEIDRGAFKESGTEVGTMMIIIKKDPVTTEENTEEKEGSEEENTPTSNMDVVEEILSGESYFFRHLNNMINGVNVKIEVSKTTGGLMVNFFPSEVSAPFCVNGTAQEMDEGFFSLIQKPIEVAKVLQVEVAKNKAAAPKIKKDITPSKETTEVEIKTPVKKSKPDVKKVIKPSKPVAPDMFAGL